jgi:hypothetical protein
LELVLDQLDKTIRQQGVYISEISYSLPADKGAGLRDSARYRTVGDAIGADFVRWVYEQDPQQAKTLELTPIEGAKEFNTFVKGFNLSELNDGSINFNGLLFRVNSEAEAEAERLMDAKPTAEMVSVCELFKQYLAQATGKSLILTLPERLYVRSNGVHFATKQPVSLATLGNPPPKGTTGSFYYPNDVRGLNKGLEMPPISQPGLPIYSQAGASINTENLWGASASIGLPTVFGATRIQEYSGLLAQTIGESVTGQPIPPLKLYKREGKPPTLLYVPILEREQTVLKLAKKSVGQ